MIVLKVFFLIITIFGVDSEGWVTLERPKAEPFSLEGIDPSIWVTFAKTVGAEKILVKFPHDPTYRYLDPQGKEIEIFTVSEEQMHRLHIQPAQKAPGITEKSYSKDGFWVFERLITTHHNTYFFQTKTISLDPISHRQFVDSFDVENVH